MTQRGGYRPGAGRKSKGERTPVTVRFPPELLLRVERAGLKLPDRHDVILGLIEKGLQADGL